MDKQILKDNDYLILKYDSIINYGKMVKLLIDGKEEFYGTITSDVLIEMKKYPIGAFAKLYILIDENWLYIDKNVISYKQTFLNTDNIKEYYDVFCQKVKEKVTFNG